MKTPEHIELKQGISMIRFFDDLRFFVMDSNRIGLLLYLKDIGQVKTAIQRGSTVLRFMFYEN